MNRNKFKLAAFRREDMKMWPEDKKEWVRLEAKTIAARGVAPDVQELGLAYDRK